MTRATLLHVLDHPTALGPAEVRELEQLAQTFPYCQTAHLLLAKAAHDQGTMLAGQRLRRAATYAADRTLLRRLIEQVAPAAPTEVMAEAPMTTDPAAIAVEEPTTEAAAEAEVVTAVPAPVIAPTALLPAAPVPVVEPIITVVAEPVVTEPASELIIEVASDPIPATAPAAIPIAAAMPELLPLPLVPLPIVVDTNPDLSAAPAADAIPALLDREGVIILTSTAELEAEVEAIVEAAAAATAEFIPAPALVALEDLPAQAPAIRPPAEVGAARFEFGLAETPPAAEPAYQLPGLVDEWAAAAVTRNLSGPGRPAEKVIPGVIVPVAIAAVLTPAAFTGDNTVGYALGESSRLGFSMQLLNLLSIKAGTPEYAAVQIATSQTPATPLPPPGAPFEPDPLLLQHWATHCPPVVVVPSSLDLINNFLRRQPRLTRGAMLPPTPNAQTDLSVRSTNAVPDLASESLARILVRQGKTARAIEVYERLMVKQPEKIAYFTAQIQQLQPPA